MPKIIFAIWGCSACGKSSLADCLARWGIPKIKTTTTRPKRYPSENDYHFVTANRFRRLNTFASTHFAGHYYGSDLDQVRRQLKSGLVSIILTWSGIVAYHNEFQNTDVLVVPLHLVCDPQAIRQRLANRQDSHITSEEIERRLQSYRHQAAVARRSKIKSYQITNLAGLSKQDNVIYEMTQLNTIMDQIAHAKLTN